MLPPDIDPVLGGLETVVYSFSAADDIYTEKSEIHDTQYSGFWNSCKLK